MRPLRSLVAATVAAVTLAACSGGSDPGPASDPGAAGATGGGAVALEEGVAATVNGTPIPSAVVSARVDAASETPQIQQLLEGEQADAVRAQLRASVVSQLIVNQIVQAGAEDLGLTVDDEAVAETREELVANAGGEGAFDEQVAAAGLDDGQLLNELEALTALRLVQEELSTAEEAESATSPPSEDGTTGATPSAPGTPAPSGSDAALEQWLVEQLQAAEVEVDPAIGSWDPVEGAVVPAGLDAGPTDPGGHQPTG